MRLGDKQREFTKCIGILINYATAKGYGLTFGDAYRDKRVHGDSGIKKSYSSANSVHKLRLAVDFNLFVDNKYISDGNHLVWKELGTFWESLNKYAKWGGRFGDGNHLSFVHNGYK